MFRPFVGITLLFATFHASAQSSGSVAPAASCGGPKSVSMMLFNFQAPFVSETFARRIAQIVIEEKYPQSMFVAAGPSVALDAGSVWKITLKNALVSPGDKGYIPTINDAPSPRDLTVEIL
jgi:hypothetical protein